MNSGQRSDTFLTAFHDAVTDGTIAPFPLPPLIFLYIYMGVSTRSSFRVIVGCRKYRDHYDGDSNKWLPEKEAARIQHVPRKFQHTQLRSISGVGGKDKISEEQSTWTLLSWLTANVTFVYNICLATAELPASPGGGASCVLFWVSHRKVIASGHIVGISNSEHFTNLS